MNLPEIESIIDLFCKNQLTHLDVNYNGENICIKKENITFPNVGIAPTNNIQTENAKEASVEKNIPLTSNLTSVSSNNATEVKSPMVGVYYASSSPEMAPYVSVGDTVKVGDVIGLIEAMKMMNEITSPVSGKVTKILTQNEELVEFDQVLFVIEE